MLRRFHPLSAVLVAAAVSVASIPIAHAGPEEAAAEDSDQLSAAAVEAFHAKDYDKAIELFEAAYEADPQPNYKFNIGRVYEEKGDQEEQAEERAEAQEDEPKVEPMVSPPMDDGATDRKRKLRIAGYSLMGVGGAGLIIGAVFGGLALSKSRDADDAALVDDKIALRQDAKTRANVADAMFITGGILAGVGLILVLTTLGKGKRARSALAPSFGNRSAGLSWAGRF
jgi:tetratricopeptide (TPR) repeat protein